MTKEERSVYNKKHYLANKSKYKENNHNNYQINKDKISARIKSHKLKNIQQFRDYQKRYTRSKRQNNINYQIASNLRRRISSALSGGSKSNSTLTLLGCSVDNLKQHLQSKFTDGMAWNNYGKWHIDHIKPCSSFDLTKASNQKECFHYSNLQPLWALDNIKKSDNIIILELGA